MPENGVGKWGVSTTSVLAVVAGGNDLTLCKHWSECWFKVVLICLSGFVCYLWSEGLTPNLWQLVLDMPAICSCSGFSEKILFSADADGH